MLVVGVQCDPGGEHPGEHRALGRGAGGGARGARPGSSPAAWRWAAAVRAGCRIAASPPGRETARRCPTPARTHSCPGAARRPRSCRLRRTRCRRGRRRGRAPRGHPVLGQQGREVRMVVSDEQVLGTPVPPPARLPTAGTGTPGWASDTINSGVTRCSATTSPRCGPASPGSRGWRCRRCAG